MKQWLQRVFKTGILVSRWSNELLRSLKQSRLPRANHSITGNLQLFTIQMPGTEVLGMPCLENGAPILGAQVFHVSNQQANWQKEFCFSISRSGVGPANPATLEKEFAIEQAHAISQLPWVGRVLVSKSRELWVLHRVCFVAFSRDPCTDRFSRRITLDLCGAFELHFQHGQNNGTCWSSYTTHK